MVWSWLYGYYFVWVFFVSNLSIYGSSKGNASQAVFHREAAVQIVGKTEKEAIIHVVGERVFQDQNGIFEYLFPLKQRNNELIIEVIGANGKKTIFKKMFELLN